MAAYHEIVEILLDCKFCGIQFRRSGKNQVYCSVTCRQTRKRSKNYPQLRSPLRRACVCGVCFTASGKGSRRYCSDECRSIARRKQLDDFAIRRRERRKHASHREREVIVETFRRHQNPDVTYGLEKRYLVWRNNLLSKYRIDEETYWRLFSSQDCRCAICSDATPKPKASGSGRPSWHPGFVIDHGHSNGRIRGILCGLCNIGLGAFRDRPQVMHNASIYLSTWSRSVE